MGTVNLPPAIEKHLQDMPMLSEVAHRLLMIISDERHSVRQLSEVIEQDVYIASRILRIANSVEFNRGHEISSIQRAVVHLGESLVFGIAMGASTGELLNKPLVGYDGPEGAMWKHCLQVAFAARSLAKRNKSVEPDQAYTAGLLMDFGMTVMSEHLAEYTDSIIQRIDAEDEQMDFADYEREVIGVDHAQVGAEMAARWNLPEALVAGIRDHHRPTDAPAKHRPLVYTLHIADLIARMAGFGVGSESLSYTLDKGYLDYYHLDSRSISELMLEVLEEYSKVERSLFS
jgi:putative nucleotidyltransferase with HDIG domain